MVNLVQLEHEVQQMSDGVCLLERDCAGSEDLLRKEKTTFARIKREVWVLQLRSSLGCLFFLSLHCLAQARLEKRKRQRETGSTQGRHR